MNTAEIKLNLFRRIDSLEASQLERVYNQILSLLNTNTAYDLTNEENQAIDDALKVSEHKKSYSHEQVVSEAKKKYPNLHFK